MRAAVVEAVGSPPGPVAGAWERQAASPGRKLVISIGEGD
jgi:hypothetical protein